MNRRTALSSILALSGSGMLPAEAAKTKVQPFIYSLNMSTLRGHKLGFRKELEVAAKAGFGSVEIWINTLQDYLKTGGTLQEAKKIIDDLGIKVEDAIGFATWIVDDETARAKALEQLKMEMEQLAQIGCPRVAGFKDAREFRERQCGVNPRVMLAERADPGDTTANFLAGRK